MSWDNLFFPPCPLPLLRKFYKKECALFSLYSFHLTHCYAVFCRSLVVIALKALKFTMPETGAISLRVSNYVSRCLSLHQLPPLLSITKRPNFWRAGWRVKHNGTYFLVPSFPEHNHSSNFGTFELFRNCSFR